MSAYHHREDAITALQSRNGSGDPGDALTWSLVSSWDVTVAMMLFLQAALGTSGQHLQASRAGEKHL